MFGSFFGANARVKPPPDCACCGAKPGADHAADCTWLSALKADANNRGEHIEQNGNPWWLNALRKRDRRIAELEAEIAQLKSDR